MHDGRLQVMRVNWILNDMKSKVVGLAVLKAGFGAAARHPHRVGLWMVITPIGTPQRCVRFDHRSSAKLTSPNDQRRIEHPKSLQVLN